MIKLLSRKQVSGNEQIDILKKYGANCIVTDYAIMLGTLASEYCKTKQGQRMVGNWWIQPERDGQMHFMASHGGVIESDINPRWNGIRPALTYSSIEPFVSNKIVNIYGVTQVEYGWYPQTVVSEEETDKLEQAYYRNLLSPTGNAYTSDSVNAISGAPMEPIKHIEYEYQGMKYIRMIGNENNEGRRLLDGRFVKKGETYFIRVEPIIWLIDEAADIALSRDILLGGIPFYLKVNCSCKSTVVEKFLNDYFIREISFDQIENIRCEIASSNMRLLKRVMEEIKSLSDTEAIIEPKQFVKKNEK